MKQKRIQYLTGAELRQQIWLSKLNYCHHLDELPDGVLACKFDHSGDTLPQDMTGLVRHFTLEHVPESDKKRTGRQSRNAGHEWTNFRAFKIYQDGQEIVRSHWTGGFDNGHFTIDEGRLTNKLGAMIVKVATHYAKRPNWAGYSYNDEMRSAAMVAATRGLLLFDDSITDNSFAYLSVICQNAFIRVWKEENTCQKMRDKMLIEAGHNPSINYQDA